MKTLLLSLALVFSSIMMNAQTTQTVKPVADKVLKDTTINDVKYKLYVGSRGGKYVLRTSKKTGNVYKQYIKK